MSAYSDSRFARSSAVFVCAFAILLITVGLVVSMYVWNRHAAQQSLESLRADALSSSANGLIMTAEELNATEMYVDLDGMLRSDAHMPLISPSLSPDCQMMVYMDPTRGSGDICIFDLEDKTTTILVESPAYENEPYFSNRGDKVYFFRADDVGRHIFALDLKSNQVVQVTRGESIDELSWIAENDTSLIIRREPTQHADAPIPAGFYEIDLQQDPPHAEFIGDFPHYSSDGRYAIRTSENDGSSIWVHNRRTGDRLHRIGRGSILGVHPTKAAVLVSHSRETRGVQDPDDLLGVIDLDSTEEHIVGSGHNAIFLNDKLVFFSQGYENKCFVHNLSTSVTRELAMPTGYLTVPRLYAKCGKATIFIEYPNEEEVWSFGLLDAESQAYEEVLRIDMNKIRATKSDKRRAVVAPVARPARGASESSIQEVSTPSR